MARLTFRYTADQASLLARVLFRSDGAECVALMVCGRAGTTEHEILVARDIVPLADSMYLSRRPEGVTWKTDSLIELLQHIPAGDAVVACHSHPNGFAHFSRTDDAAALALLPSISNWTDSDRPHGQAVLLPDGSLLVRTVTSSGAVKPFDRVVCVGDDLNIHDSGSGEQVDYELTRRNQQVFGEATTRLLRNLSVAVVGVSGTGSPVAELLLRLGVGELVLVDPDVVQRHNLNRILHATAADAEAKRKKVDVVGLALDRAGLPTRVVRLSCDLGHADAIRCISRCDVLMGCVDGASGRAILEEISAHYLLPYVDAGVRIDADGHGGIDKVSHAVHYVQPDRPGLRARGVYTAEQLRSDFMARYESKTYDARRKEKYVLGADVDRPAVASVTMLAAAMAVNELLARLLPYRLQNNADVAAITLCGDDLRVVIHDQLPIEPHRNRGRGDRMPLLGLALPTMSPCT